MTFSAIAHASTTAMGGVPLKEPGSEREAEKLLTGAPLTQGYKPSIPAAMFLATRGQGYVPSMLSDVELMLLHPCVVAPYDYYRSAIQSVKFKIRASSSAVGEFVLSELQKFWARCLTAVQSSYDYGWIGGELSYQYDKGLLGLYSLETFHPLDCWALTVDDSYVGMSVQNIPGAAGRQTLWGPKTYPAKAFWFAHNRRWDRYYGRSQLYGAWRPWRRLGFRDGAEEVIDGGVYRFAYRGPIMRYPVRSFSKADGSVDYDGAQSKAREFVENAKAGASVALPNTRDAQGNYEWDIDWPDHTINVSSLVEYAKYLEAQISLGIGVPMELLQASDTGSGWSGRKVPMLGFYQGQKRNANAKVVAWKWQVGDPLVAWNFGPEAWFDVGVELVLPGALSEEGQQPPGGAGAPPAPPPGGGGENPLAGLMGGDQGGEMSTLGGEDVLYLNAMEEYGRQQARRRQRIAAGYDLGITLADEPKQPRYRAARSRSGGLKAVNVSDPTDVKYGEEARKVLAGGGGKKTQEKARRKEAVGQETMRRAVKEKEQPAEKKGGPEAEAKARQLRQEAQKRARAGKPQQAKELLRRAKEESERTSGEEQQFEREVDQELEQRQQAQQQQEAKQENAKKVGLIGKMLGKVGDAFKSLSEKGQAAAGKATEKLKELNDKSWEEWKTRYANASGPQRALMRGLTVVWDAFYANTPFVLLGRMRDETAEQNRAAKERKAEKQGKDTSKIREKKSNDIIGMIEVGLRSANSVLDGLAAMDPTGLIGPTLKSLAGGPILSGAYLAFSAATNPLGTLTAAWRVLSWSTKKDMEQHNERGGRFHEAKKDAERLDSLPEDHPEREHLSYEGRKRIKEKKEALERAKKTSLGFELSSDGEEKLYPGLRHRIREVFEKAKDPDWAEAIFYVCLDRYKKDVPKAVEKVEELLQKHPGMPAGEAKFEPETWFGLDPIEDEDEVDADEDSAELGSLVADSLWVLTMPDLATEDDLTQLQRQLRKANPQLRAEVSRRVTAEIGK